MLQGELTLCLASEAYKIIEVQQIEPGQDVLASLSEFRQKVVKKLACLDVIRSARVLVSGPGSDFPGLGLSPGIGVDPLEDFSVAFPRRQLGF